MTRITVIGCGRVGLISGACYAEMGHQVICVDKDEAKISALQTGGPIVHEEYLSELLAMHYGQVLRFTTDLSQAVESSDAIVIAVGTPMRSAGETDLSQIESLARQLGCLMKGYKVIIEKSTVPAGTSDWIRKMMELNGAPPDCFDIAANPEFLREGTGVSDFLHPERIILGADSERAMVVMREIYRPLTSAAYYRRRTLRLPVDTRVLPPVIEMNTKTAELLKYACNCFLAMKVSYVNAIANLCESLGADIDQLCVGLASDSRIGARFLSVGLGFGGSGFAKDLLALDSMAGRSGCNFHLLQEVLAINESQIATFLKKVRRTLWTLKGKRLAVLGIAYKGGTDDIRDSPAMKIIDALLHEKCKLAAYDPAAMASAEKELEGRNIEFHDSPYSAAEGCDAILILTDWPEFGMLDLALLREKLSYPIVIDGRNLYTPETMRRFGLLYTSIGRPEEILKLGSVAPADVAHTN